MSIETPCPMTHDATELPLQFLEAIHLAAVV